METLCPREALHKNVETRAYLRSCSDLKYARVFGFSGGRGRPTRVLRANDAGSAEPALVIRRQSTLRVGDSEAREDAEEWYVPEYGVVLKQKTTFTRSGEVADGVATSTSEWQAVRRT